jgi:hypothetical protein
MRKQARMELWITIDIARVPRHSKASPRTIPSMNTVGMIAGLTWPKAKSAADITTEERTENFVLNPV